MIAGNTIRDFLEHLAEDDHDAIDDGAVAVGTRDLAERVISRAAGLRALGLGPGDRVVIPTGNGIDAAVAMLATMVAGLVQVPISPKYEGAVLDAILAAADPAAIWVPGALPESVATFVRAFPGPVVVPDEFGANGLSSRRVVGVAGLVGDRSLLPAARPADPAAILFTSGTTGRSKGVVLPQGYFPAMGRQAAALRDVRPGDRDFTCLPLVHSGAFGFSLFPALAGGATSVIGSEFSASRFWVDAEARRVQHVHWLGGMVGMLLSQPERPSDRAHGVRVAYGAGLPAAMADRFSERFGVEVFEVYGSTETGIVAAGWHGRRPAGSVGPPVPGMVVSIEGAAEGGVGEICVRPRDPNTVTLGYFGLPEESLALFRDLWLHTGDLGTVDGDGFLSFAGRLKDAIRVRGQNVSAFEVEEAFVGDADIVAAAAIPIGSDLGDEEVALIVVPAATDGPSIEELADRAAARLPRFMRPKGYGMVDALPVTETSKVKKPDLVARVRRGEIVLRGIGTDGLPWQVGPAATPVPWVRSFPLSLQPHAAATVNAYLVETGAGYVLIDTGFEISAAALGSGLAVAGVARGEIAAVSITHGHADHVGAARRVRAAGWLTGDGEVLMHRTTDEVGREVFGDDLSRFTEQLRQNGLGDAELPDWEHDLRVFAELADWPTADRLLDSGDRWTTGGVEFQLLRTPGHSPDHAVVTATRDGESIVFLGDMILGSSMPRVGVRDWVSSDPIGDLLASWRSVAGLAAGYGLPGHGRPVSDIPGAARTVIGAYSVTVERFLERFAGSELTAADIMRSIVAPDAPFGVRQFAFYDGLSMLRHLAGLGFAERMSGAVDRYRVGGTVADVTGAALGGWEP